MQRHTSVSGWLPYSPALGRSRVCQQWVSSLPAGPVACCDHVLRVPWSQHLPAICRRARIRLHDLGMDTMSCGPEEPTHALTSQQAPGHSSSRSASPSRVQAGQAAPADADQQGHQPCFPWALSRSRTPSPTARQQPDVRRPANAEVSGGIAARIRRLRAAGVQD